MYYLFSSLFLLFMGFIWNTEGFQNVVSKFVFLGLGFWGMFNYLALLGYILKV